MQVQTDYEVEVHLAAFRSAESADAADRELQAAGVPHSLARLEPGRYQVVDPRLSIYSRAVLGAAIVGAIIGALIGIGLALGFFGAAVEVMIWLAVAGIFGGAIIGSLVGLQVSARYDADAARTITIPDGQPAVVITYETSQTGAHGKQVRQLLKDAGVAGYLDVASYDQRRHAAEPGVIVESTGVGGQ